MTKGYQRYKNDKVLNAKPEELTLMLYEGMIKFNNQAMRAIEKNEIEKAHNLIVKTENIILSLRGTLDDSYEVAKDMDKMYDYIYRRLSEANVKKDKEILEEVHEYLKDFRDTWKEAMEIAGEATA